MLDWLNQYASAIQAVAAVVTTVVTVLLVIITARYVRLTGTLALVAEAQRQAQRARETAECNELGSYIGHYVLMLTTLPKGFEERHFFKYKTGTWPDVVKTTPRFLALASRLEPDAVIAANWVVSSMIFVRGLIDDAARRGEAAEQWQEFDWETFRLQVDQALENLEVVTIAEGRLMRRLTSA